MTETINICLVGGVSVGKSTILNAFFGTDYAQCNIKRTTMMPNIFVETNDFIESSENINKTIQEINHKIIQQTEAGKSLCLDDYGNELKFNVDSMNISKEIKISIYDIPGLNDGNTNKNYYDYLEKNFHKFNIILFVVDIMSGLNTSDEMGILIFLATNIKKHQTKSKKNINMLTIVNKADDMTFNPTTGKLIVEGELGEMFGQIQKTVGDIFSKHNIQTNLLKCIPICGYSAHLYTMIQKNKDISKLTREQILKIGVNDMGTKFRNLILHEQDKIIQQKIHDNDFVGEQIKLSGFKAIKSSLSNFIADHGSIMIIENIYYELDRCSPITLGNFILTLTTNLSIIEKIKKYDKIKYEHEIKITIKKINTLINKKIQIMKNVYQIIFYYQDIVEQIKQNPLIKAILDPYWKYNDKPDYIVDKIVNIILTIYSTKQISIENLYYFNALDEIGHLKIEFIDLLLTGILSNSNKSQTFDFTNWNSSNNNIRTIVELFEKIKNSMHFINFLRFFLINIYSQNNIKIDDLLVKKMLFCQHNEIPMYEFISFYTKNVKNVDNKIFYIGLVESDKEHLLELYYISKCKELNKINTVNNPDKPIDIDLTTIGNNNCSCVIF